MTPSTASASVIAPAHGAGLTPATRRAGLLAVIAVAVMASLLAAGGPAGQLAMIHDGAALTRLLRFMAMAKACMAVAAASAVFWRLSAAIAPPWFIGYAASCAAMAAGPGLIWGMAHLGLGALLLHGGLLASIILLWRDPAVSAQLAIMVSARRATDVTRC